MNGKINATLNLTRPLKPSRRNHTEYMIKGEIWLEKNDDLFLDLKRVTLLSLIDKFGSLAAAARAMRLSYNTAWLWIMAMNRLSPQPLVERGAGGSNGGYSVLTRQGHKIIEEYNRYSNGLEQTINVLTGARAQTA